MNITTFQELQEICLKEHKRIYEVMISSEAQSGENSEYHTRFQATRSLIAMEKAIETGLNSKEPSLSGMSGGDCVKLQESFKNNQSLYTPILKKIMTYALATSEENFAWVQ